MTPFLKIKIQNLTLTSDNDHKVSTETKKRATLFEHTLCSSYLKGTQVKETGRCSVIFLEKWADICKRPFLWYFTCQLTAGKDERILDLTLLLTPQGLWDETHQVLKIFRGSTI